jgi:hypothetical protein
MSQRQPTRAELLARLATSSKDAVVLEEMQRLGFWPAGQGQPTPEAALIQREAELVKTLHQLQGELQQRGDPQAALALLRTQRKAEAKARREATAQARERRRFERAQAWHQQLAGWTGYLGQGVSAGLQGRPEDAEKPLGTPVALAQAMGLPVAELRFLCFHREVASTSHYRRFTLPKKTGGRRTISAPLPRLKRAQYWVLDQLLAPEPCHPAAHGFRPGRSIVSNAAPHAGQDVVINLDLQDFFPSIHYPRVKGVFRRLGHTEPVATVLALLCTENPCDELRVDGERFFVGRKAHERVLPQGAPTSPAITNLLCRRLDTRLAHLAAKLGFAYSRYADDLSFSASGEAAQRVGPLLRQVRHIVRDEGFTPHPDKLRIMRRAHRQEVTGLVVNQAPAATREQRRALRAALHQARAKGLAGATWNGQPASAATLLGAAQFVHMVQPQQGAALLAQARALAGRAAAAPAAAPAAGSAAPQPAAASAAPARRPSFRQAAAAGQPPQRPEGRPWWQPRPRPAPVLQLTDGQRQAQRQQRLNAQRAERDAQRRADQGLPPAAPRNPRRPAFDAAAAAELGVPRSAQDAPSAPGPAPVNWFALAVQSIIMLQGAVRSHSALVFMLGCIFIGVRLVRRSFGWVSFFVGFMLILVVGMVLRL